MMSMVRKCALGGALISILTLSVVGLSSTMQTPTPLMPSSSAHGGDESHSCPMSPLEHISWWNTIFAGVPLSVALVAALFLIVYGGIRIAREREVEFDIRAFVLKRQRFRSDLFSPLGLAFSDGILHSKLFSHF